MAETMTSKSQARACKIANLKPGETYDETKDILISAGLQGSGIPNGHTWRTAKKLSDDELLNSILLPTGQEVVEY